MANRVKYFLYLMPHQPWNKGERYTRLNIEATRNAMRTLTEEEFLVWLYCSLLPMNTSHHFTPEWVRTFTGFSVAKTKCIIKRFFELGYLTYSAYSTITYLFHAIPAPTQYTGEKLYWSFTLYIQENIGREVPNAHYRAFNLDVIYSVIKQVSTNTFKLWLDLVFRYTTKTYDYSYAEELNIDYNRAVTELSNKRFLVRGKNNYVPFQFFRCGEDGEKELIEV